MNESRPFLYKWSEDWKTEESSSYRGTAGEIAMLVNKVKVIKFPSQKIREDQGRGERGQRLHYLGIPILTMELDRIMTYISTTSQEML